MLTKCNDCGFYNKTDDEFCFGCGIKEPTKEILPISPRLIRIFQITASNPLKIILSTFLSALFIFGLADWDVYAIAYLRDYFVISAFAFGFLIPFLSFYLLNIYLSKKIFPRKKKNVNNLNSLEKTIEDRLEDLKTRLNSIGSVFAKINEHSSAELRSMKPKLISAREIVVNQFARYELQKYKIELFRLQNSVSPYLFSLHRLSKLETEKGLVTIEKSEHKINKIRQDMMNFAAAEFPSPTIRESEHFLSQLSETENSCEKLREALLSKQAIRALQGIAPIEENLKLPSTNDIVHSAETFNLQATLTDFSESFEELEREYRRVRAENEASRKLLEN